MIGEHSNFLDIKALISGLMRQKGITFDVSKNLLLMAQEKVYNIYFNVVAIETMGYRVNETAVQMKVFDNRDEAIRWRRETQV